MTTEEIKQMADLLYECGLDYFFLVDSGYNPDRARLDLAKSLLEKGVRLPDPESKEIWMSVQERPEFPEGGYE
jgi:hypothetical protein